MKNIEEAIDLARSVREQPELVVDGQQAKEAIGLLGLALEANPAYLKAVVRGQETFVLVEQDELAPETIRWWADRARDAGVPSNKVMDARLLATTMEKSSVPKKYPD